MHTGIISFANRIVQNIKTNDTKDLILKQLYSKYNIKIIQKQFHRLDDNNIKHIINNPHYCCLRTNGNPYYMFFTEYNEVPIIYFVDKKIHPGYQKPRILIVRGMFSEELFKNTVIDGEMVKKQNGKWLFLMNDIIVHEGKHLTNTNMKDRMIILYNLLESQYTKDEIIDTCEYKIKNYYNICQNSIDKLIEISEKLDYSSRGIYFWSSDIKYKNKLVNFNDNNIINVVRKVKDETEFQTIEKLPQKPVIEEKPIVEEKDIKNGMELWLSKSEHPDVYYIYDNENTLIANNIGNALIPNLSISKILREAFKNTNVATLIKCHCKYNDNFKKWYPTVIY